MTCSFLLFLFLLPFPFRETCVCAFHQIRPSFSNYHTITSYKATNQITVETNTSKHKLTHNLCSNPLSSCSLCNSTNLSHFAMFFLAVRTKSSIVLPTSPFFFFSEKSHCPLLSQSQNKSLWIIHHSSFSITIHHQLPSLYYLPVPLLLNDPSAGSPTDTLLRLLLPLDIKVQILSDVLCLHHIAAIQTTTQPSTIFTALPNR